MKHLFVFFSLFLLSCSGGDTSETSSFSITTTSTDVTNYISNSISYTVASSEAYVLPTEAELTKFDTIMSNLLAKNFEQVANDVASINFKLVKLSDTKNNNAILYCLQEVELKGQGFYCINFDSEKAHHISAPHSKNDQYTNEEAIAVMRGTKARYLSVSTTHRCANAATSLCDGVTTACGTQGAYKVSDMAHNVNSYFYHFGVAVFNNNKQAYTLQLHGCGSSSCPSNGDNNDILARISAGTKTNFSATEVVNQLSNQFNTAVASSLKGTSRSCSDASAADKKLCGTTNTLGRYINGQSSPCTNSGSSFSNSRWLHIEQNSNLRKDTQAGDLITPNNLITAINKVL